MTPLWTPSPERVARSNMTDFRYWIERRTGLILPDYGAMHRFSCKDVGRFWELFVDYTGVIERAHYTSVLTDPTMPGATWFDGMRLNFAENVLERGHGGPAIMYRIEPESGTTSETGGFGGSISFYELAGLVARCARGHRCPARLRLNWSHMVKCVARFWITGRRGSIRAGTAHRRLRFNTLSV